MLDKISSTDILLDTITNNEIYIYGTGLVSERFAKSLIQKKLYDSVKGYIVTCNQKGESIRDRLVYNIDDFSNKEGVICIAVHESIKDEIIDELKKRDINNYVWIYPYLLELVLGNCKKKVKVNLSDIWKNNREYFSVAVRYAAIKAFYNIDAKGYEMYLKGLEIFCTSETAKKRLESFKMLMKQWEDNGYNESYPSVLVGDNICIDGTHRLALACFHQMDYIVADVFEDDSNIDILCQPGVLLTKKDALNFGLTEDDIRYYMTIIDEIDSRLSIDRG